MVWEGNTADVLRGGPGGLCIIFSTSLLIINLICSLSIVVHILAYNFFTNNIFKHIVGKELPPLK